MIFLFLWRYQMELSDLDVLKLFTKTLNSTNVNAFVLKKNKSNLNMIDNRFRERLYNNFSYDNFFDSLENITDKNTLVTSTDTFLFHHLYLRIPEKYLSEGDAPWLFVGPFSEGNRSADEIRSIMRNNQMPERLYEDISGFYSAAPVVDNAGTYEQLVRTLASGLFGIEYHLEHLPADRILFRSDNNIFNTVRDNPQMAKDSIAERYRIENELMSAISAGDYDQAHEMHEKFISYHIRARDKDPLRNQQHLAIIHNTLCRKAAESGGVHPLYIDELSTRFAVLINRMTSINDVKMLTDEMVHKYCLLVKNYAMKGYSGVIKEIISYVDFHYAEDLNLNFFSKRFNVSKTYLSNLFRKETGSTLTDFIHQTRMRKAIALINSSSLPVTAIATACGYNDINYFIRVFKRTYGLSPKQYQKKVMHADH